MIIKQYFRFRFRAFGNSKISFGVYLYIRVFDKYLIKF